MAAVAGGLLVIWLAAACDDGGGASPTATAPLATPTMAAAGALPLERFHYAASLRLSEIDGSDGIVVSTEGDFHWPDRHAFTYTTDLGDGPIEQHVVIIGETAWLRRAGEPWQELTLDDERLVDVLEVAFSAVRPNFLGGPEFERVRANLRNLASTEESINDVTANHYRVGTEGRRYLDSFLVNDRALEGVEDVRWDLWLAKLGAWPVRLLVTGTVTADFRVLDELDLEAPTAWELRIDVSRPNDPTLLVQAPDEEG